MESKMNIKNIIIVAAVVISSFVFLNMSLAANTIKTENPTEGTTTTTTEEENKTEEEQTKEETEKQTEEQTGKYFLADNVKAKVVPLINAADAVEVQKNQEVSVDKVINGWAYVEIASTTENGWVRVEKLKTEEQKQADDKVAEEEAEKNAPAIKKCFVQPEKVNLRKENSTSSDTIGKLPQNTEVEVIAEEGKWSKCRVNGMIGFISTQYLGNKKVEEKKEETSRGETTPRTNVPVSKNGSGAASLAQSLVGSKYVHGATGPNAFDCSGLTYYIYQQLGITIGRTSYAQAKNGVSVSKSEVQPGDILIFKGGGHVGIYVGGDTFVHAGNPSTGVKAAKFSTYRGFVDARRIL